MPVNPKRILFKSLVSSSSQLHSSTALLQRSQSKRKGIGSPVVVSEKAEALSHSDTTMKLIPSYEMFQLLPDNDGGVSPEICLGNEFRNTIAATSVGHNIQPVDAIQNLQVADLISGEFDITKLPDPFKMVEKELQPFSDSIKELVSTDQPILSMAAKHVFEKRHGKRFRPTIVFWIILLLTSSSSSKNGPLKQSQDDTEAKPFVTTTKPPSVSSSPLVMPLLLRSPSTTPPHAPSSLTMSREGDMDHHHPTDDNNNTMVDTKEKYDDGTVATDTDNSESTTTTTTTTAAAPITTPPTTTEYDDFVPADRVPADAIVLTDDDEWNDDPDGGSNNHTHNKPLRPYNPKPKPLYFIVLGERHSGVDYVLKVLHDCFGDEHRYGSGYKRAAPWFQTYDDDDVAFRMDAHMHYRVILILATRNPYDWVQDMYHKPLYLGEWEEKEEEEDETKHKVVVSLKDFVTRPWSYQQIPDNTTNGFCQLNYLLGQVSPCLQFPDAYRFPKSVPVYELNAKTSRPYANILEFRAAKIQHWMIHLNQSWGISPMILPMDNNNPWTTEFANDLFNRTAGEEICLPTTNNTMSYVVESYANTSSVKFMEWMNANVNWEMEQIIGYYTRQQQL